MVFAAAVSLRTSAASRRSASEGKKTALSLASSLSRSITALNGHRRADARRDADAVYHLAFGALRRHLTRGTQPTRAEVDHLARFALSGIGRRGA